MSQGEESADGRGPLPSAGAAGTVVAGKYRVDGVLGEGGMGVVLAATHVHLREKVAIKLLHAARLADAGAIERFMREARAASRIRGEHVARVFDVGLLDDGSPYLVMEHLEGQDLSAYVASKGHGLPIEEAVDYVLHACLALAEAHAAGIVHRDLKPANLFLTRKPDGAACVKVLDFGISKTSEVAERALHGDPPANAGETPEPRVATVVSGDTLDGPPNGQAATDHRELRARPYDLTRTGAAVGSPRYMAPEQIASPRDVDARADIWSLGAVLFELVTGRAAFGADSLDGVRGAVQTARFTRVRDLVPSAPEALERIIARCLVVDRAQRFDDVVALARALAPLASREERKRVELALRGGRAAKDSGSPLRAPRRIAGGAAAGALLVCGVIATVVVLSHTGSIGGAHAAASSPALAGQGDSALAMPSLSGPPVPAAHGGDCAELPAFASDGSLVYLASRGPKRWIERVAPGEHDPRTLVDCPGACWYPAPGGDGRVEFAEASDATSLGLEVRSVALDGSDSRVEAARGRSSWRAGASLFFIREDNHAIMHHAANGSIDETLFEAPSAQTFRALTASPDGDSLAVTSAGLEARGFANVCFGPSAPGSALDCHSVGESTSQRPSFGPDGRAFYFARGRTLVRFDPRTKSQMQTPLPFAATSLAVAPAGDRLVASTCETSLHLVGWSSGVLTPLPAIEHAANELALGPHGEMAYPITSGEDVQLVVADESGEHTRVLTSGPRRVTEAAFSPDGRRIAFADSGPESPGIYVLDANGARSPLRLTSEEGDCEIGWLDDDQVVYLHPAAGYAYGRMQMVRASGSAPEPLATGDGIFLGVARAHHALLVVDWDSDGTRYFERTLDGHERELVFAGAPPRMKTAFSGASVSGRYITWVGGGGAWVGDTETMRASRVPLDPKEQQLLAVFADDDGRAVVTSRVRHGGLFEVPGAFP